MEAFIAYRTAIVIGRQAGAHDGYQGQNESVAVAMKWSQMVHNDVKWKAWMTFYLH